MLFNPEESIDLQGQTGPFVQYSYARIQSIKAKVGNVKVGGGLIRRDNEGSTARPDSDNTSWW